MLGRGCLNCGNQNSLFTVSELSIEIKKLRECLRGRKLEIWGKGGVFIRPSGNPQIVIVTRSTIDFKVYVSI